MGNTTKKQIIAQHVRPKKAEKKFNTFGAKDSKDLKRKIDSTLNASNEYGLKSHFAFTSGGDGTQEAVDKANKRSMYYDRLASDADYAASRMKKSLGLMKQKENEAAAKAQAGRLSVAPADATSVARISIPLAETQFHK